MKPLLDGLGLNEGVRVMQGINHLAENAEQFLGLRSRSDLGAKPFVNGQPVHLPQRKKGILLGESLPEDLIIRQWSISERMAARLGPGTGAAKQNVRDAAVFVEPTSIRRRAWKDSERIVAFGEIDFVCGGGRCFACRCVRSYTTQRCDLITL